MSKMLMGQINHARERIGVIKQQKYGEKPAIPKQADSEEVLKKIRQGELVVGAAQLRAALSNFVNRTPVEVIESSGGCWDYRTRTTAPKKFFLKEVVRTTFEECLSDIVAPIEFAVNLDSWKTAQAAYEARVTAVDAEAVAVEDAIVLGDQQAALLALQAFAAYQPE